MKMKANCRIYELNTDGSSYNVFNVYRPEAEPILNKLYKCTKYNKLYWQKLDDAPEYAYIYNEHKYIYSYGTEVDDFFTYLFQDINSDKAGVALVSSEGAAHIFSNTEDLFELVKKQTAPEPESKLLDMLNDVFEKLKEIDS